MKDKVGSANQTFTVWAPLAKKVRLHIVEPVDQSFQMKKDSSGYFNTVVRNVSGRIRYFYSVDGGSDLPDPASQFQPDGVMGPSERIDHDAFQWDDDQWRGLDVRDLVIYELHVGTFTQEGTFDAMISR
jgi:maltooligosyltrehalose trehalohydrolase